MYLPDSMKTCVWLSLLSAWISLVHCTFCGLDMSIVVSGEQMMGASSYVSCFRISKLLSLSTNVSLSLCELSFYGLTLFLSRAGWQWRTLVPAPAVTTPVCPPTPRRTGWWSTWSGVSLVTMGDDHIMCLIMCRWHPGGSGGGKWPGCSASHTLSTHSQVWGTCFVLSIKMWTKWDFFLDMWQFIFY